MRSYIFPLAALVASALAAPLPKDCVTEIHGDKVVEIYDVTITSTVYVTAGAEPTTTALPVYVAPVTTEVYVVPSPTPTPEPVYEAPTYNAPVAEAPKEEEPAPVATGDDAKCLETHNKFRSAHGAPPLKWSQELADHAKSNTGDCTMHHSGGPYGENLAFGYGDVVSAITAWYDEKNSYDYSNPGFQGSTGHYTQVIWKATTELGCYNRQCGGSQYLMCEYRTPGNVMGNNGQYFRENVQ